MASAVVVVLSNPCVGPSPRTNIYFFLLSECTDELLSIPEIKTFLPQSKPGYEKSEQESNSLPYPELEYLSGSAFLVDLTANKQSFRVKSTFKSCDHLSNSKTINKFTTLLGVKFTLSVFKQLLLNSTIIFELCHVRFGERLLFDVVEGDLFSHLTTFSIAMLQLFL